MATDGRGAGWAAALAVAALIAPALWAADGAAGAEPEDIGLVASLDQGNMAATIAALQGFGSREFHLGSAMEAAEFLHGSFEGFGAEVEHQYFAVGDALVSNVVATIPGSGGDGMYLFGAHYDSENSGASDLSSAENLSAPGADDDASGVAAVLEIARVLSGAHLPWTVKFVMFGAEEYGYDDSGGCKGSEYFVKVEEALGHTYAGTAVLDMVGYRAGEDNRAVLVLNDGEDALARSVAGAVDAFGVDLSLEALVEPDITFSDHGSFWDAGIPSMLVIEELGDRDFPVNPYYHTAADTLETLAMDQVEAVAEALLGGLLLMDDDGGADLLLFGTVIMSAATVSVALYIHFRRRRGRASG
ncbi:MAG: M20/M25/M40 family metallo-hydrolase [Candidatus Thermoplasmatota archaeon]